MTQQRNRAKEKQLVSRIMRRYGISDPDKHIAIAYPEGILPSVLRVYQLIDRSVRRDG